MPEHHPPGSEWERPSRWHTNFEDADLGEILDGVVELPARPPKGRTGIGRGPKSPGRVKMDMERALYEADVVKMRVTGMTEKAIAEKLGICEQTVRNCVKRALRRTMKRAGIEEQRSLVMARLDALIDAAWPLIDEASRTKVDDQGNEIVTPVDTAAIDAILKIDKQRRELLGLDAARKYEVSGGVNIGATEQAVELGNKLERFMELADKASDHGLSAAPEVDITEEARLAGIKMRSLSPAPIIEVVDAELVEPMPAPTWDDDDPDPASRREELGGTWVGGKWVPDE